jgi:hypothetical protein
VLVDRVASTLTSFERLNCAGSVIIAPASIERSTKK